MNTVERDLVFIDEIKCNGCGKCVIACAEGALAMVDGKAKLISDKYCDGLGACLPDCPTGAISVVRQKAQKFNYEETVKALAERGASLDHDPRHEMEPGTYHGEPNLAAPPSALRHWPVQLGLILEDHEALKKADLLIAADCTAFSYGNFHQEFMKDKVTLIACPKLDEIDYRPKLTTIFRNNDIQSVTVVRMNVFCCRGLERAVSEALIASGKEIPLFVRVLTTEGKLIDE